jgi:hypothetical protein
MEADRSQALSVAALAVMVLLGGGGATAGGAVNPDETSVEGHRAEAEREHAAADRAAAELERFEAAECKEVPPRERAACPLLGPVTAIQDLGDGVRVEIAPPRSVDAVVADMRCHYAFARARGFSAAAAACPLYVQGISIERAADGRGLEVRGETPALAREIRTRVRQEAVFARGARGGQ